MTVARLAFAAFAQASAGLSDAGVGCDPNAFCRIGTRRGGDPGTFLASLVKNFYLDDVIVEGLIIWKVPIIFFHAGAFNLCKVKTGRGSSWGTLFTEKVDVSPTWTTSTR